MRGAPGAFSKAHPRTCPISMHNVSIYQCVHMCPMSHPMSHFLLPPTHTGATEVALQVIFRHRRQLINSLKYKRHWPIEAVFSVRSCRVLCNMFDSMYLSTYIYMCMQGLPGRVQSLLSGMSRDPPQRTKTQTHVLRSLNKRPETLAKLRNKNNICIYICI